MNDQPKNANQGEAANKDTVTRKVAEALHDRINQAADAAAKIEQTLHEKAPQARDKIQELGTNLNKTACELGDDFNVMAHKHPWAVASGAIALGIIIGAMSRNR